PPHSALAHRHSANPSRAPAAPHPPRSIGAAHPRPPRSFLGPQAARVSGRSHRPPDSSSNRAGRGPRTTGGNCHRAAPVRRNAPCALAARDAPIAYGRDSTTPPPASPAAPDASPGDSSRPTTSPPNPHSVSPPSRGSIPPPASIPSHSSQSFPIGDLPRGHQLRGTFLFRSRGDIINSRQQQTIEKMIV